ncbi:MAG: hypothetical protein OHK0054_10180 [Sideroxydans sp.]
MIEYIFFSADLRDRFIDFVQKRGLSCTTSDDPLGMVVAIPEDIPETLSDEIEAYYDTLEDEQEQLSEESGELYRLTGFGFSLPNGEARLLPVEPALANRLLAHFSMEEIRQLLEDAAACALSPNQAHLCKVLAARRQPD